MRPIGTLALLALIASGGWAATPIDQHTTFLASFDQNVQADYCAGDWRAGVGGEAELVPGRFGNAVALADRQSLVYNADGKINLAAGTIEFWVLWTRELAAAERVSLFTMTTPEQGNYVNFNKIQGARLGMPVKGGPADDFTWQRTDVDFSGWEVGSWHYLTGTWEGGVTRIYADGQLAEMAEGGAGLIELPTQFSVGPGPLVIDELRISSIARTPEEIAARAAAEAGEVATMYLTDQDPTAMGQAVGAVGLDVQTAIDDREMPLVIGTTAYARGVALRAPGFVEFIVPEGLARLRAVAGLSPFGREGASAELALALDGTQAQSLADLSAGAQPIDLAVEAGQTLRIEATGEGADAGAVVVVGDALLLAEGADGPPPFAREMDAGELEIQRMRTQVAQIGFDLPPAPRGYVIYAGHPVDAIDLALEPLAETFPEALSIAAAPGEYEAAQFCRCGSSAVSCSVGATGWTASRRTTSRSRAS